MSEIRLEIDSLEAVDAELAKVRDAAAKAHEWIASQSQDPMLFLKSVKFEKRGFHPISHKELNLIEQVNQTWTYAVALAATRLLLEMHPEANGYWLAPGAHMAQPLDIMSKRSGFVGAEVSPPPPRRATENLREIKTSSRDVLRSTVTYSSRLRLRHTQRLSDTQFLKETGCKFGLLNSD